MKTEKEIPNNAGHFSVVPLLVFFSLYTCVRIFKFSTVGIHYLSIHYLYDSNKLIY